MTLEYFVPEYLGLAMVISGGQCGADRAGVEAAADFGIRTGGTVPKGWRTHFGSDPSLANFNMVEDLSFEYPPRTKKNVIHSTGTVIFASNPNSPGCTLTKKLAFQSKKPCITFILVGEFEVIDYATQLTNWIETNKIVTLNVAGNRDKQKNNSFHHDMTYMILNQVFINLKNRHLLVD